MSGEPLIAPSRPALFGKLPAHGDFVRRGDPATVGRLDAWLTGEVERMAASRGDALDAVLAGLPCWGFVLTGGLAGALSASHDRVGRVFPFVCCAPGGRAVARGAAALLGRAESELLDADAVMAALAGLDGEGDGASTGPEEARWWRPLGDQAGALAVADLPGGADFDRLFEVGDMQDDT